MEILATSSRRLGSEAGLGLSAFWVAILGAALFAGDAEAQRRGRDRQHFSESEQPYYREANQIYDSLTERRREELRLGSLMDFEGDNALAPIPRIIPTREYSEVLVPGVEQRGNAIRAFLEDHLSGEQRYLREGVIPKAVIDRILARYQLDGIDWKLDTDKVKVSFPYGPDLIRTANGSFHPIEDNAGYLGGLGDLVLARQSLLRRAPDYKPLVDAAPDPMDYYRSLIESYRKQRNPPHGVLVMVMPSNWDAAEKDGRRYAKILEDLGVKIVKIKSYDKGRPYNKNNLVVTDRGVFLDERTAAGSVKRSRVGFLIQDVPPEMLDPNSPLYKSQRIVGEAKSLVPLLPAQEQKKLNALLAADPKTGKIDLQSLEHFLRNDVSVKPWLDDPRGVPGLVEAILQGKVATNFTPGTDFISDKELYQYVDRLIEFYLKEKPILPNVKTQSFATATGKLAKPTVDAVFADVSKYVVKRVDGLGGDQVWVGPKMSADQVAEVKKMVLDNPTAFQAQEYHPLSTVGDMIVDLRVHASIQAEGNIVSNTPWSRGLPMSGNGKVNLSQKGVELAVIVSEGRPAVDELRYGPEWTFTNARLLNDKMTPAEAAAALVEEIFEKCQRRGCKRQGKRITYPDGFWIDVAKDEGVVEVKAMPLSLKAWKRKAAQIQEDVFDVAQGIGLRPSIHEGGGHLNVSKDYFYNRPLLYRNYVVDTQNHAELSHFVFEEIDDVETARFIQSQAFADWTTSTQDKYLAQLREFDENPHASIDTLTGSVTGHSSAVNVANMNRVELRGYRAQASMQDWIDEIELQEARIRFLEGIDRPIPLVADALPTPSAAAHAFRVYVEETGLPWKRYQRFLKSRLRRYSNHPRYRCVGVAMDVLMN